MCAYADILNILSFTRAFIKMLPERVSKISKFPQEKPMFRAKYLPQFCNFFLQKRCLHCMQHLESLCLWVFNINIPSAILEGKLVYIIFL